MKKNVFGLFLSSFLLLNVAILNAQVLPQVTQALMEYRQKNFMEKLYVHTDKDTYLAGELIWFKVYNVDASNNRPGQISKIAYVEVIDQLNNPVLQAKIALKNGAGSGSFDIPNLTQTGKYKLRAYTNWMQNFGADTFFEKQLILLNPLSAPERQAQTAKGADLQFFPEGGELVYGLPSKVGFRTIGPDGKGVAIKGAVIDNQNDTVARFQTFKFGNGQFKFTPVAGHSYKAVAISEKSEILIKELPAPAQQGYVMSLTDLGTGPLNVTVNTSLNVNRVYLLVHHENKVALAAAASFTNKQADFQFDREKLSEGISYLTLFDEAGQPLCERLFFKAPAKKLQLHLNTNLTKYDQREKVNVSIALNNENKNANLSVAVTRLDSLSDIEQADILSYIWLTSALNGYLESPNYYLSQSTVETRLALENLLLTQGWRKINWQQVLNHNRPVLKFLPEYNGHIINGTLNGAAPGTMVYMGIPGKRLQFYTTKTDSTGKFIINTRDLFGSNEIVFQTNYKDDSTAIVAIKSPFSEAYSSNTLTPLTLNPSIAKSFTSANLATQVQHLYSGQQLKQFYQPVVDSTYFFQHTYKTYKINEYTRFNTLEEVLREYVREVLVSKRNTGFHMKIVGKTAFLNEEPLLLIDGVPRFNFDKLMPIDPNVIEKLEVVREPYYYGPMIAQGILKFTTYKHTLGVIEMDPNAVVVDYEGIQLQREFYAPLYENAAQKSSRIPDFRNVLYWQPDLYLNSQGKGEFSFYTGDQPGTYIGHIQGITADGIAGSNYFTFEVKK